MNFKAIRKLDTGLGGSGGGAWIHRIALFSGSVGFPGRLGTGGGGRQSLPNGAVVSPCLACPPPPSRGGSQQVAFTIGHFHHILG